MANNNSYLLLLLSFLYLLACQQPTTVKEVKVDEVNTYDAASAKEIGADEYGMKPYVIAFLKKGPNRDRDSLAAAQLQRAHLDNISKMAKAGKLVLAGPFMDDGDIRGMYIFNVSTIEEAKALTATDPAIQAGSLLMEMQPWYGSAALVKVNELHDKYAKKKI